MKPTRSNLGMTPPAAAMLWAVIVLLAAVNLLAQTPIRDVRPQKTPVHSCTPVVSCAADLSASTTLCKDVGPCSGLPYAVHVESGVVLKLNGYKIMGTNAAGSVGVEMEAGATVQGGPGVTHANGPGAITGFVTGISLNGSHSTVNNVHLTANQTGIVSEGGNIFIANTFRHDSCAGIVSSSQNGEDDSIVNSLITGSNAQPGSACPGGGMGISIDAQSAAAPGGVQGNTVSYNSIGIYAVSAADGIGISNNNFSHNTVEGAYVSGTSISVSGNSFNNNGQDGLYIDNVSGEVVIANNIADSNKRWGIALTNGGTTHFHDNVALGNGGYDLYETGSPQTIWSNDLCDIGFSADGLFVCPFP